MASRKVDVKYVFIPTRIHLDPFLCERKLFWLRSRAHPGKILHQIQKRTEPYGSALVCKGPKFTVSVYLVYQWRPGYFRLGGANCLKMPPHEELICVIGKYFTVTIGTMVETSCTIDCQETVAKGSIQIL